jgi:membrane dipeptidase
MKYFLFFLAFAVVSVCRAQTKTLSEEEVIKIGSEIHEKVLTVDTHCDSPMGLPKLNLSIRNTNGCVDFPKMKEGGLDAEFFAAFLGQGPRTEEAYQKTTQRTFEIINNIHNAAKEFSSMAEVAYTPADAYRIEKTGKRIMFIGIENGYALGKDITLVKKYFDLGARYITLCHTKNNDICDSSTDTLEHGGLSGFGKLVVEEMNKTGIMVDVSHISDKSFYDVIKYSKTPVFASHSCSRAIRDHNRNMTDDMLLKLKENGGVIQMCILSNYVKVDPDADKRDAEMKVLFEKFGRSRDLAPEKREEFNLARTEIYKKYPQAKVYVKDAVDHIDHIVKVIGIDYVGIGTDFDGGGGLADCKDASEMKNITYELVRRGYSENEIRKIWGGNVMRVMNKVLEYAKAK